ncbi:MAG: right-handed parallel beta-helix repeat-containing protein [Candidatus Thorarchaeota archaeon]
MRSIVASSGLLLVLILNIFAVGCTTIVVETGTIEETVRSVYVESQYTSHEPIVITSNQDFADQGWPGNGTEINPYLIQGLSIASDETCVSISSTDAYFNISDCYFSYSSDEGLGTGVFLDTAQNGVIERCEFTNLKNGISLTDSDNQIIAFNEIAVVEFAANENILLQRSDHCEVYNNSIVSAGTYGIRVASSIDALIANNSLYNEIYGMRIDTSVDCVVIDNKFEKSGLHIYGYEIAHFLTNTFENNTVGGRPIAVLTGRFHETIDASTYGQLFLFDSSDCIVENGNFDYRCTGVLLAYCSDCIVRDLSSVYSVLCLVELHGCSNTLVTGCDVIEALNVAFRFRDTVNCTLTGCSSGSLSSGPAGVHLFGTVNTTISRSLFQVRGIIAYSSVDCSIIENEFEGKGWAEEYGIRLSGPHNTTVAGNNLHGFYTAIFCESDATNGTIFNNTIHDNHYYGIRLSGTSGFRVYNNSFWYNSQANALDDGLQNYWDDSVSLGNLWNDYSGSGVYYISGSAGSIDHYPGVYQTPSTATTTSTAATTPTPPNGPPLPEDILFIGIGVLSIMVVAIVIVFLKKR